MEGYNEGQISLERFLEIGWICGVCDISLKVLRVANQALTLFVGVLFRLKEKTSTL